MDGPRLLVVGAGINGLWIALRFLGAGWRVWVAESMSLPNSGAASWDQHRLFHPYGCASQADVDALKAAMRGWESLWWRLGRSHYHQSGGVVGGNVEARSAVLCAARWACQPVDNAKLSSLAPGFRRLPRGGALWTPHAGVLFADRIVDDLIRLTRELGCVLLPRRPIREEEIREGWVRLDSGGRLEPDLIVIAAGAYSAGTVPALAPRLDIVDQTMLYFRAPRLWADAPVVVDFGPFDDLWMAPPIAGTMLKLAASNLAVSEGPFDFDALSQRIDETFDTAEWRYVRRARCRFGRTFDGARILEPVEGTEGEVWVVAGCNGGGFKLAPLVAEATLRMSRGRAGAVA